MSEDSEQYEVAQVLGHRRNTKDKLVEVRVKWKGYDNDSDITWEPVESLLENAGVDVLDIIKSYFDIFLDTYFP